MANFRPLFTVIVLIGFVSVSLAQESRIMIVEAENTFYKEDFASAYEQYQIIHEKYPSVDEINYHKEIAYLLSVGRGASMDNILAMQSSAGHTDKFYNYWLGRIHFSRYEFEEAEERFVAFDKLRVYKSNEIIKENKGYITYAQNAARFHDDPDYYEIEKLPSPINSINDEFSPVFYGDQNELIFASNQMSGNEAFRAYYSHNFNGSWESPKEIKALGVFDQSKSKIEVVNEDGKIFVYRDKSGGNLFYTETDGENWSSLKVFDAKIKKSQIESDFYINDAEDHIIYSSAKGFNGLDLYESYRNKNTGEWTDPTLVVGVNTKYDEDSPYISHDGRYLYFSSNRKPESVGGFDIFRSEYDPAKMAWSKPINMGFPINTIDDEINYQLNKDDETGYLSSNRLHSEGGFDIYYFHHIKKLLTQGQIHNKATGAGAEGLTIKFHPITYDDEAFTAHSDAQGYYQVELPVKETFRIEILNGHTQLFEGTFVSKTEDFSTPITQNFDVNIKSDKHEDYAELFTVSEKEETSELNMLGSKFRNGQKAVINNIYFATQSTVVESDHDHVIEKIYHLLQNNPDLKVEIGGHTDNIGKSDYNLDLSYRRAKKIVSLLIEMGAQSEQLAAKGYGDTAPLASNDDEVDGRELNRRIEVKVIETRSTAVSSL